MNIETQSKPIIHFAPLQGFTDKVYREMFDKHFGNIDYYYSPYLSLNNDLSTHSDSDIVLNARQHHKNKLIPQILPANTNELKTLLNKVIEQGYKTVNINAGCPYPMVIRKGRGSALLQQPDFIVESVKYIEEYTRLNVSIKLRSGIENSDEIYRFLDGIPIEKFQHIIVHPRTAKQLYKGEASIEVFKKCKALFKEASFIYNGDIKSVSDFNKLSTELGSESQVMIGRGLLENPFLALQLKNNYTYNEKTKNEPLIHFMLDLIENIEVDSKDQGHALNRIKNQFNTLLI
ncbi:MAG: tRNA-dihydrouridine synthase family protein [Prolixibacteraceae bacterium]|jgi:tRNA-dihydrouridine synthase B|nr:tRNA-dihydrouridine synthase family protein [Prolixibacteraceae bacterium]